MKRRDFIKKAGVGAVAAGAVIAGAPVVHAKKTIEITMVATWPRDFPGLGTGAQRFAKRLTNMTDGRLKVNYFAAGERVKAFDSFDEVASGNAQMYHGAEYYWKGKHPAFPYFCSVPFGLTYAEMNSWIRFGGGQELWDELGADFGVKGLMCGNTGSQMGGWFRKEINSPDDLKGLKMRIPGLGGDVMAKLGASPVSLPGGQIYENLIAGSIDAAERRGLDVAIVEDPPEELPVHLEGAVGERSGRGQLVESGAGRLDVVPIGVGVGQDLPLLVKEVVEVMRGRIEDVAAEELDQLTQPDSKAGVRPGKVEPGPGLEQVQVVRHEAVGVGLDAKSIGDLAEEMLDD